MFWSASSATTGMLGLKLLRFSTPTIFMPSE